MTAQASRDRPQLFVTKSVTNRLNGVTRRPYRSSANELTKGSCSSVSIVPCRAVRTASMASRGPEPGTDQRAGSDGSGAAQPATARDGHAVAGREPGEDGAHEHPSLVDAGRDAPIRDGESKHVDADARHDLLDVRNAESRELVILHEDDQQVDAPFIAQRLRIGRQRSVVTPEDAVRLLHWQKRHAESPAERMIDPADPNRIVLARLRSHTGCPSRIYVYT